MIEGGFPFPSVVLAAGSAGAGKTTFAQKFLFESAERGEQGLFSRQSLDIDRKDGVVVLKAWF